MFELSGYELNGGDGAAESVVSEQPAPEEPGAFWVELVGAIDAEGLTDAGLVDELAGLERLTSAAAAAKARLTADLASRRRAGDAERGVPLQRCGRGTAHEVALARRESPHAGREHVALALALVEDLPETLAALARGDINEHRAQILARESADLSREDRACVDATLGPQLSGLGNREVMLAARRLAYELDAAGAAQRVARARARRRVTSRGLGDGMVRISADVPAWDAVVAMQGLAERAEYLRACGDTRTRDQAMADEFLERLDQPATPRGRRIEIQLVMNAAMLLDPDESTPAHLVGYGPVPAAVVSTLLGDPATEVAIRRLYTNPADGALVAMDSRAELFSGGLRRMLFARDGETCRTPYCDAPVRHADHVTPRAAGGKTTLEQGQGLCAACNYAKEAPGWRHRTTSQRHTRHTVEVTTPTGHTHHSQAPPPPVPPTGPSHGLDVRIHHSNTILEIDWVLGA